MKAHKIKPGKLYDFGPYGKLYVAAANGRNLWVTDAMKDRNNPECRGWGMDAEDALCRIKKSDSHPTQ